MRFVDIFVTGLATAAAFPPQAQQQDRAVAAGHVTTVAASRATLKSKATLIRPKGQTASKTIKHPGTTPAPTGLKLATVHCTPSSVCFDGFTCGVRYGGCYDANYCTGSAIFPIPTCNSNPALGLSKNNLTVKKKDAAAAAVSSIVIEEEVDGGLAIPVVVVAA